MSDPQHTTKIPRGLANDIKQLLDRGVSSPDVVQVLMKQSGMGQEDATSIVREVMLRQTSSITPTSRSAKTADTPQSSTSTSPIDWVVDGPAYNPRKQYTSFFFNRGCAAILMGLSLLVLGPACGVVAYSAAVAINQGLAASVLAMLATVIAVGSFLSGLVLIARGVLGRI